MECAVSRAKMLICRFLGCEDGAEGTGDLDLGVGVSYKQVRSAQQGDLYFSRKIALRVQEMLKEKVAISWK